MLNYRKEVDWSTLREGFTLPSILHNELPSTVSGDIQHHGNSQYITLIIEGTPYPVKFTNVNFDRRKHCHVDVIQIRYSRNSTIAKKLRQIFTVSWAYISEQKKKQDPNKRKCRIIVPNELKEYLIVRATLMPDVYKVDCIRSICGLSLNVPEPNAQIVADDSSAKVEELSNQVQKLAKILDQMKQDTSENARELQKLKQRQEMPMSIVVKNATIDLQELAARSQGRAADTLTQQAQTQTAPPFDRAALLPFITTCDKEVVADILIDLLSPYYQKGRPAEALLPIYCAVFELNWLRRMESQEFSKVFPGIAKNSSYGEYLKVVQQESRYAGEKYKDRVDNMCGTMLERWKQKNQKTRFTD